MATIWRSSSPFFRLLSPVPWGSSPSSSEHEEQRCRHRGRSSRRQLTAPKTRRLECSANRGAAARARVAASRTVRGLFGHAGAVATKNASPRAPLIGSRRVSWNHARRTTDLRNETQAGSGWIRTLPTERAPKCRRNVRVRPTPRHARNGCQHLLKSHCDLSSRRW